jgi:hypothetical protein
MADANAARQAKQRQKRIKIRETSKDDDDHESISMTSSSSNGSVLVRRRGRNTQPAPSAAKLQAEAVQWLFSSAVNRTQMLASFVATEFEAKRAKARIGRSTLYLFGLPDIDLSNSPLLVHAIDATCLAQIGAEQNDDRLIQASRQSYGSVLRVLNQDIGSARPRNTSRDILTSIMLLCLLDDTLPAPGETQSGWLAHYWGIQEYLKTCKPSDLTVEDDFNKLLLRSLNLHSIFLGITRRQAVGLGRREWLEAQDVASTPIHALSHLFKKGLQLPGILNTVEDLIRGPSWDPNIVRSLEDEVTALRDVIDTEYTDESTTIVHLTDQTAFDIEIEEHSFILINPTIAWFYKNRNGSYNEVDDVAMRWAFVLMLDCALLRLLHFQPGSARLLRHRSPDRILRDAYARAIAICRTLHGASNYDSQAVGAYCDLLVALANNFFEEIGAVKQLGWTQGMRCAISLHIERLKYTRPRTLCKSCGFVMYSWIKLTDVRQRPTRSTGGRHRSCHKVSNT